MGIGVIGSTTVSGTVSTSSSLVSPVFGCHGSDFPSHYAQGYGICGLGWWWEYCGIVVISCSYFVGVGSVVSG